MMAPSMLTLEVAGRPASAPVVSDGIAMAERLGELERNGLGSGSDGNAVAVGIPELAAAGAGSGVVVCVCETAATSETGGKPGATGEAEPCDRTGLPPSARSRGERDRIEWAALSASEPGRRAATATERRGVVLASSSVVARGASFSAICAAMVPGGAVSRAPEAESGGEGDDARPNEEGLVLLWTESAAELSASGGAGFCGVTTSIWA